MAMAHAILESLKEENSTQLSFHLNDVIFCLRPEYLTYLSTNIVYFVSIFGKYFGRDILPKVIYKINEILL